MQQNKLIDGLINNAEWWITGTNEDVGFALDGAAQNYMSDLNMYKYDAYSRWEYPFSLNDYYCMQCLLEAEFQKDEEAWHPTPDHMFNSYGRGPGHA